MGLILREIKGSKLTITEMDDNLKYLESINSGTSGTSGSSGKNGTSGIDGTSGINGTSGSSGKNGTSGIDGTSGINGSSGTTGTSGSSGSSGTSGTSGTTGTAGTSGIDGTSGINGTSGSSGTDGTSGISMIVSGSDNFLTKISGTTITESNIYIDGVDTLKISTHKGEYSVGKNIFIGGGGDLSIGEDGNNQKGSNNTFVGYYAGSGNTLGNYNTFIGNLAGRDNTEGYYNTFIGNLAGLRNSTGNDNTFVGNQTGLFNEDGYFNTNIGSYAGYNDRNGQDNTYIGFASGYENRNGVSNVFIGSNAGRYSNTGNNTLSNESVFIGYNTKSLVSGSTNEIVIGSGSIGNGNNTITYGNGSITNHVFTSGNLKINSIQNITDNETKLVLDNGILKQVTGITSGSGTSGTSGINGTSGSSGINGTSGTSGTSGINGTSGTSSNLEITGETFTTSLFFDKNKYYEDYTQTRTLNFTEITGGTIMNVIYSKIYVDTRYNINFDTDFNMYRNDLSTDGVYDFWFTKKPSGVAYSIVKIDDWTPPSPVEGIPYSGNTIARYSSYDLVLDETSGKITQIVNDFNTGLTLFSNTDSKRPLFDDENNKIVFNLTGVTENLSGTTTKLFTSNNTWYITFMIEFQPETTVGGTVKKLWTLSRLNDKMLTLYNAADTHYINNSLKSITTDDLLLRKLGGVHVFGVNQTTGGTELYIDNTFITSNTITSTSGLTLSNLFSTYNATSAQPLNIRYLYDCLIYDRDMNSSEREEIQSFFVSKHTDYNPSSGGTLSDYMTSGLTSGSTLSSGSTINVTFTFTGSTPTEIVTIWKQGTSAVKALTYSSNITILNTIGTVKYCSGVITVPTLPANTNYFSSSYILDENGRSSNNQDYTGVKFQYA